MRDYSKVGPKFWIGATGKRLRTAGVEAQIVAMYLLTSPHANMLGLYYCPEMFIAHETGLGLEGASKGLQRAIEAGFCEYDEASEVVWVIEMASYQIGDALKPNDLRVKGVQNEYGSLPDNPYLVRFYEKYKDAFCMSVCRGKQSPMEAPSKPLRSQEQEQEQEQEKEKQGAAAPGVSGSDSPDGDEPEIPGTPDGPDAPEDPPSGPADDEKSKRALGIRELVAEGVDRQHAEDWLKIRRAKKAPLTETALDIVKREAAKAGMTLAEAIAHAASSNWAGFKAKWLDQPDGDRSRQPAASGRFAGFEDRNYGTGGRL
ncbi:hypothetical protein EYC51_15785 [Alcaligenes faecalis]|nr:hypothetical protein EYC51_15785 [Alcaligenes faecalis]